MAISFIQYDDFKGSGTGNASITNDTTLNTTSGNIIIALITYWDNTDVTTSVTDTAGNTYVKAIQANYGGGSNQGAEIWYAENIDGHGSNLVTANFGGNGTDYPWISVAEFSGVSLSSSLDDTSFNTQDTTTSHTSGNATATGSETLIIGVSCAGGSEYHTPGSSFTALSPSATNIFDFGEYKIVSGTGDYSAPFTTAGNLTTIVVCALFKIAVVGTNISINIADTFKDVDSMQINIGDVWKDVTQIQQNIGDAWKTVF